MGRLRRAAWAIAFVPVLLLAGCVPTATPSAPAPAPTPVGGDPLPLRAGARAYFLGDSYTEGTSASVGQGYANVTSRLLGWVPELDAEGGTSFLNAGRGGAAKQAFPARAAAIPASTRADVVIVEGGLNDANDPTIDLGRLPEAVRLTISELRARFPKAPIVLMGPESPNVPPPSRVIEVDTILRTVATQQSVEYVSPLAEQWLTADMVGSLIDPTTMHPNTAGHAYIGARLAFDLERSGVAIGR